MPGAGGTREWGVSRVWFQCGMLGNSVDGWHDSCTMGMCAMPLAHTLADDRNGLCYTYLTTVKTQNCAGQ